MPTDGEVLIEVRNLEKSFGDHQVLKDISLDVHKGEVISIIGPSGCGKSTFLRSINLLERPTGGSIMFEGVDILDPKTDVDLLRRKIGMVFQSFNLIDELTVEENVDLQLRYMGVAAKERRERVTEILRKVGLSHRAKHYPQQLSGGQQQRVAIARAVVGKPKLILADEPTGNLDSKSGLAVMELLSQLNAEGTTIVMVTHSQHDAQMASRIINLFDGQVVEGSSFSL